MDGQIGLESHPREFIEKMVFVFREVKRVMKPTGSLWLNLGDTFFGSLRPPSSFPSNEPWLQPKQKMLIPHRVAIAMQDDGWILRNDVVWAKPNSMPSSVKDRLRTTFEYVFHFVKKRHYFFDLDAIREPHETESLARAQRGFGENKSFDYSDRKQKPEPEGKLPSQWHRIGGKANPYFATDGTPLFHPLGKNPGDVWRISPVPFSEAHFACYPPELCRKPLLATCPKWICEKCGKARTRIVEPSERYAKFLGGWHDHSNDQKGGMHQVAKRVSGRDKINELKNKGGMTHAEYVTKGWTDCGCGAPFRAGTVLDPFVGSGTTLQVAQELGLNGIGIELNPKYVDLVRLRLNGDKNQTALNPNKIRVIEK